MPKLTFRNMRPGQRIAVEGVREPQVFLGFSDTDKQYGSGGVAFAGWDDLAAARGFKNAADLDGANTLAVSERGYGYGHYAIFRDAGDDTTWTAYRYNGAWVYGSSADRLPLNVAE